MIPGLGFFASKQAGVAADLLAGVALSALMAFARASSGWATDSTGTLLEHPSPVPRFEYSSPAGLTQFLRNPRLEGATSAGALPTGASWLGSTANVAVVGVGVEDGMSYMDVQFSGIPSSATERVLVFNTTTETPAAPGQAWTFAAYTRVIAGSTTGLVISNSMRSRANGGLALGTYGVPIVTNPGTLANNRQSVSATLAEGTTAFVAAGISFRPTTTVNPVEVTLRISLPQLYMTAADPGLAIMPPPGTIAISTDAPILNLLRNPRGEGATLNVRGDTQATIIPLLPNNWAVTASTGMTVLGNGVEDGIPYTDILFDGTANSTIGLELNGSLVAAAGETYTVAAFVRLISGDISQQVFQMAFTATGVTSPVQIAFVPTAGGLRQNRYSATLPVIEGSTIRPRIRMVLKTPMAFTLRIGAPQVYKLAADPGLLLLPPPGIQGVSGDRPLRGLLMAGQRTNALRNPRGEYAATPSFPNTVLPTYWSSFNNPSGIVTTVVGQGVENGIPYTDINWAGTGAAAATIMGMAAESLSYVSAAPGDVWTGSAYCRLVGGSMAGVTEIALNLEGRGSGTTSLSAPFIPTSAALATQRQVSSGALTAAGITSVWLPLRVRTAANVPVDITLRVGGFQLEKASTPSSLILPPVAAQSPATRAAEALTMSIPAGSEGSLAFNFSLPYMPTDDRNAGLVHIDAPGTPSNRLYVFIYPSGNTVLGTFVDGNVSALGNLASGGGVVAGVTYGFAISWGPAGVRAQLRGQPEVVRPMPNNMNIVRIGNGSANNADNRNLYGLLGPKILYSPKQQAPSALLALL